MKHYDAVNYQLADSVGYLIRRGGALLRHELDTEFVEAELTPVQWLALMELRDDPRRSAAALCRALNHDSGAFTRVLDQLEEKGFLARERSVEDRRSVRLILSPAGLAATERALPMVVSRLNEALADFTVQEVADLKRMLNKLIARLEGRANRTECSA